MDDIYTKLDEFVRDSLYVISDKIGVARDLFDVSANQDIYDEVLFLFYIYFYFIHFAVLF